MKTCHHPQKQTYIAYCNKDRGHSHGNMHKNSEIRFLCYTRKQAGRKTDLLITTVHIPPSGKVNTESLTLWIHPRVSCIKLLACRLCFSSWLFWSLSWIDPCGSGALLRFDLRTCSDVTENEKDDTIAEK